jgi:hypothetical protein
MVSLYRPTQAMLSIEELKALRGKRFHPNLCISISPTMSNFLGQPDSGIVKVKEEIHVALYPKYLHDIRYLTSFMTIGSKVSRASLHTLEF